MAVPSSHGLFKPSRQTILFLLNSRLPSSHRQSGVKTGHQGSMQGLSNSTPTSLKFFPKSPPLQFAAWCLRNADLLVSNVMRSDFSRRLQTNLRLPRPGTTAPAPQGHHCSAPVQWEGKHTCPRWCSQCRAAQMPLSYPFLLRRYKFG